MSYLKNGLLIALFLFFLPQISLGATIFEDNFNSYIDGDLKFQGGWQGVRGKWNVEGYFTFEGEKAIYVVGSSTLNPYYYKDGLSLSEGKISFHFYKTSNCNQELNFRLFGLTAPVIAVDFKADGKINYYSKGWVFYGNFTSDIWHSFQIEWETDFPLNKKYAKYSLDNENWTDWQETFSSIDAYRVGLESSLVASPTGYFYVDYIAENPYTPPIICSEYYNKIDCESVGCFWWEKFNECNEKEFQEKTWVYPEIPNPDDTIEIYNPSDDLILKGKIKIGFDDGQIWAYTKFYSTFTNLTTGKSFTFEKDLGEVMPNEIIDYEENLGMISEILPDYLEGNFKITYKLFGRKYLQFWEQKEIIVEDGIIAISEIIVPPYEYIELPELVLDNCEGLGTIEKWLCEIKNTFKSVFYPSTEKIQQLKYTINLISQKSPFNYLKSTKDFFTEIKNGVETKEVNFKILGQSGILSFAGLDYDVENGGGIENFISIFKKFFTFILLIGLIFWSISFIRKFWK